MKILIISDYAAPYRVEVFKGLAKEFDIDLFFTSSCNQNRNPAWYEQPDSILQFDFLDRKTGKDKFKACAKKICDYDLLLCYNPWTKAARALQRRCICKRIPYILNADGALNINKTFPKKQIKEFYVKRAALCFAGCDRAIEYFKTYGADPSKIVKHSFTSLCKDQILKTVYTSEQKSEFKQALGIENKTMFVSVGQFIFRKGFDILLDAWKKASDNYQLYIIGGGHLYSEYCEKIESEGIKNVHMLDFLKGEELFKYYAAADAFVFPTREDIWGLVVGEAMANGLPVIASNRCTAANELIENQVNGFVYDCNDTDSLSRYIKIIGDSDDMRVRFGLSALETIKDYTYENVISSHIKSIKDLFSNSKS